MCMCVCTLFCAGMSQCVVHGLLCGCMSVCVCKDYWLCCIEIVEFEFSTPTVQLISFLASIFNRSDIWDKTASCRINSFPPNDSIWCHHGHGLSGP